MCPLMGRTERIRLGKASLADAHSPGQAVVGGRGGGKGIDSPGPALNAHNPHLNLHNLVSLNVRSLDASRRAQAQCSEVK